MPNEVTLHPLLRRGRSAAIRSSEGPGEAYDLTLGLWLDCDGLPIVESSTRPRPLTKKEDVETGEDHKGT